ncbi:GH36-type glycosyl hydrolase domain-containing protein [Hydrogenoanaerobacterium sp.]|uniref:GH36-type glycosyl hydrolase domain-containing protein n=1 Tax=Hydrogenoanaerobacterium sp. TaxID=2953763 RepID=UPI00289BE7C7|nr:glucoamylase family protein [Hydrogenoanaerobacterium sp.]
MNESQIKQSIAQVMKQEPVTAQKRPKPLRRQLLGNLRRMKRLYRNQLNTSTKSPVVLWLCDNFYVLEKEAKQTARELQTTAKLPVNGKLPQLSLICDAVLGGRPAISQQLAEDIICEVQQYRDLTITEFGYFPLALRITLLSMACSACIDNEDERGISYAITSLTKLAALDFDALVCKYSIVEATLLSDPAGVYPNMEKESRGCYRVLVGLIAEKERQTERACADQLIRLAKAGTDTRTRHVGLYILNNEVLDKGNRWRRRLYMVGTPVITYLLAHGVGYLTGSFIVGLLSYLPLREVVRPALEYIVMAGARIEHIPRMDKAHTEQTASQTVVAVSILMPRAGDAPAAARRLEQLYWNNAADDLCFCLLADFKESDRPACAEDDRQVQALEEEIRRLNAEHGERFMLFVRGRVYNKTQGRFSGWERKRGAITEFIRYAKGDTTSVHTFVGNKHRLRAMRYLLALDSDTNLLFDTAGRMISAAAHPLNRAVIDHNKGIVTQGYGIFVPRISTTLESQGKTPFSRIMAGIGGITAYDEAARDLYQDLFHEAIFAGKGLLDTDCFYMLLNTRFPENQILSHDILESAYLRTALLSDVELSDSFPSSISAWLARLHRWIRGDWQNLRYIFGMRNPINALSRFKLYDNLRRSLTPVINLICVLAAMLLPQPAALALFWVVLLSVGYQPLIGALTGAAANGMSVFSRKFFTRVVPQAIEQLAIGVFTLVMLPQTALRSLHAIVLALYRQFISHKNLLQWVTAADSEGTGRFFDLLRHYWLAELIGIIVLFFSPHAFLHFYGLAFSAILPFVMYTSRAKPHPLPTLDEPSREQLVGYLAAMWRFFETYATEQENFLPPDNIQQSPVYAVAHRTSPTNIGLLLLSTLAARDLDFISTDELCLRIERILDTVQRLPKWHGNLYNWYDTASLALLEPRFVSSVDSGNFVCSLVTLKEGLHDYSTECAGLKPIITRVKALIADTDLSVFYDKRRNLFSIGYNETTGEMMDNYYDFFMSEARMTGFYAIASRQVSKRHWGAMNRTMSQQGAYAGPVSWTGTMFEYFMPHLLLPVYDGSLLSEALGYCVYCQRRRVHDEKVPWGISESAFYLFDGQLNYQYKAHGVQKLGVKRGLNHELVVSPYSTFLTLPFFPVAAMKNLRRMEQMGFYGTYGFFEAIDFTKSRVPFDYGVCRSFMSHHIGMSMVAACNALFENKMQNRFIRDRRMNAAKELLQEKVCRDTVVYDNIKFKDLKEREPVKTVIAEEYDTIRPQSPQAMLLSNGAISDTLTDTGAGFLSYSGVDLTRRPVDLLRGACGVYAFVNTGKHTFSLTAAPVYDSDVRYRVEFLAGGMLYKAKYDSVKTGMRVMLHPTMPCEQREYQIKNLSQQRISASLLLYFEPTLAADADYAAHPAFSKLFVTAEYDEKSRVLIFTRRERSSKKQLYFATGFLEDIPFEYEAQRENLMQAPNGLADLLNFTQREFTGGTGTPDAAGALRLSLDIPAGARAYLTQILSAGQTREEAVSAITRLRGKGKITPDAAATNPLLGDTIEGRLAFTLLPQLMFPKRDSRENDAARAENNLGKPDLWGMSISGDRPIVSMPTEYGFDRERAAAYISLYRKCKLAGVPFDLVFTHDASEPTALTECINRLSCTDQIGAGLYLINTVQHGEQAVQLLQAAAVHIAPKSGARVQLPVREYNPVRFNPVAPLLLSEHTPSVTVMGGVFADDRFYVERETPLPFSHILANPAFGTLVSDTSLGFTWAVNARENKLTPWQNDIATGNNGEMLILRSEGCFYNLVHGARCSFSQTDARYEGAADDISCKTVVTVPERGSVKQVAVTLTNHSVTQRKVTLAYYTEPVLGVSRTDARHISATFEGGKLMVRNPFQTAVRGVSCLCSDTESPRCMCDRVEFFSGRWENGDTQNGVDPCAALLTDLTLPPKQDVTVLFRLIWAANAQAALRLSELTLPTAPPIGNLLITTPDRALDVFINHFVPHQILQCRIWGRTAFYQCGGAYGFRDQLQDITACLLFRPKTAKYQILRAAAAQFPEGDVLHWWHNLPKSGGGLRGVRTKYSDDLLWLPYAVSEYVRATGDSALLDTAVPFVQGEPLGTNEKERYFEVQRGLDAVSVYEHCLRAIEKAYNLGEYGLPLIGCGDWNDGFNGVGNEGRGQSVWLAMFLVLVLQRFLPLVRKRGDTELAMRYEERIALLKTAIDEHCWDGAWYLRAFYDNGSAMGSKKNDECSIDSLPQSFSVLCEMPDQSRVSTALDSALHYLADPELRIVKLFDKPFANSHQQPGYVKAYPPGIRENGGQYTHAGVWLALALLEEGRADDGYRLLDWLNPVSRCQNRDLALRYKQEPYYLAADIYTNPNVRGRGGWSMYTGASSWYYKTVTEHLLGIWLEESQVRFEPCMPSSWQGFELNLTLLGTPLHLTARRGDKTEMTQNGTACSSILLDGVPKEILLTIAPNS